MRPITKTVCAGVVLLALDACTAGSAASHAAASGGDLPQFLLGVWHGLIAPVTLIIEVINRLAPHVLPWSVHMYESKNVGVAYDVGFFLGMGGGPSILWGWSRRR